MICVGVVQNRPSFGALERNLAGVAALLQDIHADLLVLPELFATGYLFDSVTELEALAEPAGSGPIFEFLTALSKKKRAVLVAGFAEKASPGFFNSSYLVTPDGFAAVYRKIHLFSEEKRWFFPGNEPFRVHQTPVGRLGMMICFDWIFPESVRSLAIKGAQIVCHSVNLVLPFCQDAMLTRSIENRVFILTANRVGADERAPGRSLVFTGRSQIVAPGGRLVGRMESDETGVLLANIDPELAEDKDLNPWNNLFKDRRPEMYGL